MHELEAALDRELVPLAGFRLLTLPGLPVRKGISEGRRVGLIPVRAHSRRPRNEHSLVNDTAIGSIGPVERAHRVRKPHVVVQQPPPVPAPRHVSHPVPDPARDCLDILTGAHVTGQHRLQHSDRLIREIHCQKVQTQLHAAELRRRHDIFGKSLGMQILHEP